MVLHNVDYTLPKRRLVQCNVATKHNKLYVATLIVIDGSDNTW
jgi:hypothetical protein